MNGLLWRKGSDMETQVIEGTFLEVQRQLRALHLNPKTHLRLIVTESDKSPTAEEEFFAHAPRRNGLILAPTKDPRREVTVELVKALSED